MSLALQVPDAGAAAPVASHSTLLPNSPHACITPPFRRQRRRCLTLALLRLVGLVDNESPLPAVDEGAIGGITLLIRSLIVAVFIGVLPLHALVRGARGACVFPCLCSHALLRRHMHAVMLHRCLRACRHVAQHVLAVCSCKSRSAAARSTTDPGLCCGTLLSNVLFLPAPVPCLQRPHARSASQRLRNAH